APLKVGKMSYDLIVVANCMTLREHTLKMLAEFKASGGRIIFMGRLPQLVDAKRDARATALTEGQTVIPQSKDDLYRAVAEYRDVEIRDKSGARTKGLMCNTRRDGDCRSRCRRLRTGADASRSRCVFACGSG
ncbi:MAG: hypothetical protein J6S76_03215, partial [Clostridia bacterium]|nr:hypothetical protein [Clostridia bacterium]